MRSTGAAVALAQLYIMVYATILSQTYVQGNYSCADRRSPQARFFCNDVLAHPGDDQEPVVVKLRRQGHHDYV